MGRTFSPLRYPGGKACLYPAVSSVIRENRFERRQYAEPFAGGAGLALALLYGGHVSDVHINDIDPSIWAFWHCVLHHTEELVSLMENTPVTIAEWRRQRAIHLVENLNDPLSLGFSAFFLNRTNRSGIIKGAGVIGGLNQTGPYKIDCRFNRKDLIRRVRRVSKYRSRIHLYRLDAQDFVFNKDLALSEKTFIFADPPYFRKGSDLYTNFYTSQDHESFASVLFGTDNPWILTYDKSTVISDIYRNFRQFEFDVNYSLETKRVGTELMIVSKGLRVPSNIRERRIKQRRRSASVIQTNSVEAMVPAP